MPRPLTSAQRHGTLSTTISAEQDGGPPRPRDLSPFGKRTESPQPLCRTLVPPGCCPFPHFLEPGTTLTSCVRRGPAPWSQHTYESRALPNRPSTPTPISLKSNKRQRRSRSRGRPAEAAWSPGTSVHLRRAGPSTVEPADTSSQDPRVTPSRSTSILFSSHRTGGRAAVGTVRRGRCAGGPAKTRDRHHHDRGGRHPRRPPPRPAPAPPRHAAPVSAPSAVISAGPRPAPAAGPPRAPASRAPPPRGGLGRAPPAPGASATLRGGAGAGWGGGAGGAAAAMAEKHKVAERRGGRRELWVSFVYPGLPLLLRGEVGCLVSHRGKRERKSKEIRRRRGRGGERRVCF